MKNAAININELFDSELDVKQKGLRKQFDLILRQEDTEGALTIYEQMRKVSADKSVIVEELTEQYFTERGEMPKFDVLERLSTWILRYMESIDGDLLVLTDRQMRTRNREKEMPFYSPEQREFHLEADGNKLIRKAPGMDSDVSHKVRVKLPNEDSDLRQFNGPLKKYFIDFL